MTHQTARNAQAALVRAAASFVRDTYSGEWADDAAATLETDADLIERGEPCSLLRLAETMQPAAVSAAVAPPTQAVLRDFLWRLEQSAGDAAAEKFLDDNPELRRMADETATETPAPSLRDQHRAAWRALTPDQQTARIAELDANDEPAGGTRQDEVWPVKEATRHYAEELRATPGQAAADGHTGWECDAGAQLLISATTPGPGALGTHHGTIYACPVHQGAALQRITGSGYQADPQPAPPGHRWNPWPCGHVTAHDAQALTALTAAGARQDGAET